jgi:hypothetical protein
MFDSPFEFCNVCNAYVLLDQTQRQCAREHRCRNVVKCPLQRFFTGYDFGRKHEARATPAAGESRG